MNVKGKPYATEEKQIVPLDGHGLPCMSIGLLIDEGEPVIWRGPMVMGVVRQFLQEVAWGYLVVFLICAGLAVVILLILAQSRG